MYFFLSKNKNIFLLFKNLEEKKHQTAIAIRALLAQKKTISQEAIDTKSIQNNYNKIWKENNYLLIENNNYTQKLKEINNKKKALLLILYQKIKKDIIIKII